MGKRKIYPTYFEQFNKVGDNIYVQVQSNKGNLNIIVSSNNDVQYRNDKKGKNFCLGRHKDPEKLEKIISYLAEDNNAELHFGQVIIQGSSACELIESVQRSLGEQYNCIGGELK